MVKRLTEYFENGAYTEKKNIIDVSDKVKFFDNGCVMGEAVDKLAQLEDILEKYGIEGVEELECLIEQTPKFIVKENAEKYGQEINGIFFSNEQMLILSQYNELQEPYKKRYEQIKTDRDTWQKACEFLAYKYAEEYFDGRDIEHCFNANKRDKFVKENINYFYQQAKKEENDEK